jgi:F-type H+-transporting ATPase subunit b
VTRYYTGFILAVIALGATIASASGGIPLAETWSWPRDGGRIFNAVITLGAIGYIVVRFGGPILRKRAELIEEQFNKLEEARAKAETSLSQYAGKLNAIKAEGEQIKKDAKAEGEMLRRKIVEQAKIDAGRILEKAEAQIAVETDKAREKIRREATVAAIDMAEELLKKNISGDDHKKLLDVYISGMEKIN